MSNPTDTLTDKRTEILDNFKEVIEWSYGLSREHSMQIVEDAYTTALEDLDQLLVEARIDELDKARANTKPHMALYLPQPYKQAAVPDSYLIKRVAQLRKTK